MAEEIGDAIGPSRLREFDRKVRLEMAGQGLLHSGTAQQWIDAMAVVIVREDDKRADSGFRKGIQRIRVQAALLA